MVYELNQVHSVAISDLFGRGVGSSREMQPTPTTIRMKPCTIGEGMLRPMRNRAPFIRHLGASTVPSLAAGVVEPMPRMKPPPIERAEAPVRGEPAPEDEYSRIWHRALWAFLGPSGPKKSSWVRRAFDAGPSSRPIRGPPPPPLPPHPPPPPPH
eukprot:1991229-Pyramimonas_sp.AAC.1